MQVTCTISSKLVNVPLGVALLGMLEEGQLKDAARPFVVGSQGK